MKTKITLLLSCFLFGFASMNAQWTTINSGTKADLTDIWFTDDLTGFIISRSNMFTGDSAAILKTTDGGYTWTKHSLARHMTGIYFTHPDTGYIFIDVQDSILRTTDGGDTWVQAYFAGAFAFEEARVLSPNSLTVIEPTYYVANRTGGIWSDTLVSVSILEDLCFIDDQTGYVAGWYGGYLGKTTDGGKSWSTLTLDYQLYSVDFLNARTGYVAGWYGDIAKSTDSGKTWVKQNSGTNREIKCIRCLDEDTCYAAGYYGYISRTGDGGQNWITETSNTNQTLHKLKYIPGAILAIGDSGTLLRKKHPNPHPAK